MEKKETFRFGVMGAGNISNKFCDAEDRRGLCDCCSSEIRRKSQRVCREI